LIFIQTLVEPLHPADRSRFLVDLAAALRHEVEIGDGILHRWAHQLPVRNPLGASECRDVQVNLAYRWVLWALDRGQDPGSLGVFTCPS
jgi:hypothetical protein